MKIYLSPSNQPSNRYCVGNTNEKAQMEAVGSKVKAVLDAEYECETVMATLNLDINKRAVEAKNKGCNVYLAIHSNAGCSTASGTIALYHPNNTASKALATNLVSEINSVCPIKSNRSSSLVNGMTQWSGQGYGEIREPTKRGMVSVLVETNFHDNPKTAQWIIDNKDAIARAIVTSLAKTFGIAKKVVAPVIPVVAVIQEQPVQQAPISAKSIKIKLGVFFVRTGAGTNFKWSGKYVRGGQTYTSSKQVNGWYYIDSLGGYVGPAAIKI